MTTTSRAVCLNRISMIHLMGKPILCLDFDGVIHSYASGWKGADVIPDPPVPGAIAFMLGALDHFQVVIFSSRSHQAGGTSAMKKWLKECAGAATGEYPRGKLDDTDEGALKIGIAWDGKMGVVRLDFGKPIAWAARAGAKIEVQF